MKDNRIWAYPLRYQQRSEIGKLQLLTPFLETQSQKEFHRYILKSTSGAGYTRSRQIMSVRNNYL